MKPRFWMLILLITLPGCRRNSQLVQSIRNGDAVAAERMISDGANVNARDSGGETSLLAAIKVGDKALYSNLLKRGADPNITNDVGRSAMHQAAQEKDSFWLREALAHGGDPNVVNKGNKMYPGDTPIYYALSAHLGGNAGVLIESGANLNYQNEFGNTAVWEAMEQSMYAEAKLLIEKGANPRLCGKDGISILNYEWFNPDRGLFREGSVGPLHWTEAGYAKKRAEYDELWDLLIKKGYLPPRAVPKK